MDGAGEGRKIILGSSSVLGRLLDVIHSAEIPVDTVCLHFASPSNSESAEAYLAETW